jgi:hypothetical protein
MSLRDRHGEVRYVAVGLLEGLEFTCVFTDALSDRADYIRKESET